MVLSFYGFIVLWFYAFLVSWFQSFTKFPFHAFLIDIDLITKIFKFLLDGYSSSVGARLFQHLHFRMSRMLRSKKYVFKMFPYSF